MLTMAGEGRPSKGATRLVRSGKVRDIYEVGDHLLLVASDRISAFDVVLPTMIPGKGVVLTQLSTFWLEQLSEIVPNHLTTIRPSDLDLELEIADLDDRAMVVRRAERIDIECVVRGYLAGSAWSAYERDTVVFGHRLPAGLVRSAKLPEPIFTPAVKADAGHDETIPVIYLGDYVGAELALDLERISLDLYAAACRVAAAAGIIIADTKFEFGWIDGRLTLIDEAVTPDSSRLWDRETYEPGTEPPSLDKQFVRSWLEESGWDKQPPGPELPEEVVAGTVARYHAAFDRLTGRTLGGWLAERGG